MLVTPLNTAPGLFSKGTPAEVLYKGTITRIIGEDSPGRAEKAREEALPKGHVIYEGKKGHILTYDGESGIGSLGPRARRGHEPGGRSDGGGGGLENGLVVGRFGGFAKKKAEAVWCVSVSSSHFISKTESTTRTWS